jgi:hypothetical protein
MIPELFCLLIAMPQDPETAKNSESEAALAWLAKAEKALLEAPAIQLKVERKSTLCMAPETWIRKAESTVVMAKGECLSIDYIERSPSDKPDQADDVVTRVRCDGKTFGVAEGADPKAPKRIKCRTIPKRFAENAAALFIRTGIEIAYIGFELAEFDGEEIPALCWKVSEARVVAESTLKDRPCVQLEYVVACFGKKYRHDLWLDRETLAPLKRQCIETNVLDHGRIMGYDETYEPVKHLASGPEGAFAIPKTWTQPR